MLRSVLALANVCRVPRRGEGEGDRLEEVGLNACMVVGFFYHWSSGQ